MGNCFSGGNCASEGALKNIKITLMLKAASKKNLLVDVILGTILFQERLKLNIRTHYFNQSISFFIKDLLDCAIKLIGSIGYEFGSG